MNYQTYESSAELEALVNCYWILEVPQSDEALRQRIIPDGCVEMALSTLFYK